MPTLASPSARAALDELVHQFADPYAFVRELVQNAIDAGSSEVEIDVRFEPSGDGEGVISVHVDDWGEGMTREVIEKRLTRLFSSSKHGDRTKIGKFGIGFVSVFSLDPDAVCIDTSRDGQSWRVLFKSDRTFELLTLAEPVDGTKIRVIKRGSQSFFNEVRERCERSLRHWCRHVEADLRFSGTSIRESFTLPDAPCTIEHKDALTCILVGHRSDHGPFRGFYNHGLTLFESSEERPYDPFGGIAFKVSSPRLEHTLTRDAVIEDAGFHAVMRDVSALVHGRLASAVFEKLERATVPSEYLARAAMWHAAYPLPIDALGRAIAVAPSGAKITVAMLRERPRFNLLLRATVRTAVTDALEEDGFTVVAAAADDPRLALFAAMMPGIAIGAVADHWCMPTIVEPAAVASGWPELRNHLATALRAIGVKIAEIVAGDFGYPESPIADRIAITQAKPGTLVPVGELETLSPGLFARKHALVLNVAHRSVRSFIALAAREPAVAAYLCVKAFRLGRGLDDDMDTKLVEHVVEQRWPTPTH